MVDAFYADNGRIQVIKNDDISFDSDRPSIQLLPDSSKLSISRNVSFPNLLSSPAYLQRTYGSAGPYCESWSALMPQEWGPDEVNTSPEIYPANNWALSGPILRNLPEELIGTVPAGTDYVDVRAKMTRTVVPPVFMQQSPPLVMFKEGDWVGLPGGSCPCEYFPPLARHFDIVLRGTSVYLRRFQSVTNGGQKFGWGESAGNQYGWFTSSTPTWGNQYSNSPGRYGIPAVLMQSLGGDINLNRRAPWASNSAGSCAVYPVDYTSVYACEFEIHPGRYKASR
ncbi:hypothetical protein WH87_04680 [Devosia epidermidihirudinis]|uniref:Uncharacterized protein n=1 Tax=Devosia epidermidihirudinis TaxID=1293439 RepID=A0A0F5QES5_9HYPH|nr:hypothetical protein [Devosia epidermidihirudinis]KKC39497.1 hypothetical protein WH87_04680 [Devosia epidermidihirudinis]